MRVFYESSIRDRNATLFVAAVSGLRLCIVVSIVCMSPCSLEIACFVEAGGLCFISVSLLGGVYAVSSAAISDRPSSDYLSRSREPLSSVLQIVNRSLYEVFSVSVVDVDSSIRKEYIRCCLLSLFQFRLQPRSYKCYVKEKELINLVLPA